MDQALLKVLTEEQLKLQPYQSYRVRTVKAGLVIVDEVNGFCTYGKLSTPFKDPVIGNLIERTNKLAKKWGKKPILAFLDTHDPDKPEYPYPDHCVIGSGEEDLVSELEWLESSKNATLIRKNCINGIIGSYNFEDSGMSYNLFLNWANRCQLKTIVVVGICTDICVLQFVQTLLSCRNHGMLPKLKDVVVYTEACATYDFPEKLATQLKRTPHPRELAQHMGLYLMQQSGAILAKKIVL
ncbi:MAG: isochorismatase family protein [Candidatus Parcubacteria bacterium]|nr:isochorismatase family protein [Candidatus Parcubacteria bacterium]